MALKIVLFTLAVIFTYLNVVSSEGTCTTTFEDKEVEITYGDTVWLNPCLFCWCYENSKEAGCNTVDCPTWSCDDGLELTYLDGKCCPSCLPPLSHSHLKHCLVH